MLGLIFRRVLYALPIAIGVTVVCFSLVHLAPGKKTNEDSGETPVAIFKRVYL